MNVKTFQWCLLTLLIELFTNRNAQTMSEKKYKIRITIDGQSTTATLFDNPTTRDFIELLPMKMELKDYAETEKIFYLPKKLSTKGAPAGSDPSIGDITYYAPWGNLALFYKGFGYSSGLIILGKIDSNMELFNKPGALTATIEIIKD